MDGPERIPDREAQDQSNAAVGDGGIRGHSRRKCQRGDRQSRRYVGLRIPWPVADVAAIRPCRARSMSSFPRSSTSAPSRRPAIRTRARARVTNWTHGPVATGAFRRISRLTCACRSTHIPTTRGAGTTTVPRSPAPSVITTSCSSRLSTLPTPRRWLRHRGYEQGNAWAVEMSGAPPIHRALRRFGGFRSLRAAGDLSRQLQLLERHPDRHAGTIRAAARLPGRQRQPPPSTSGRTRPATAWHSPPCGGSRPTH